MPRLASGPASLSDASIAALAAEVRRRGAVPRRELPKLPPAGRVALDRALEVVGLELTRSAVRMPLRDQLLSLLGAGPLDEKELARRLVAATVTERKALVAALVADGTVRRVTRPAGPALVLGSDRTLDAERTARLASEIEIALKWLRRAARTKPDAAAGVLERDVAALLTRLTAAAPYSTQPTGASAAPSSPAPLLDRLARAAIELAGRHGGLASVPLLVRSLGAPTASVHAALLEGHARGWFELQPESSMGRLGAEELALCLPGPEGTRLSWVRPLSAAPASVAKGDTR